MSCRYGLLSTMKPTWLWLIYGLATFRLAMLLSKDTGPSHIFLKLRQFLKREAKQHKSLRKTFVHEGIECTRCSSVWIAAPIAVYAIYRESLSDWAVATDIFLFTMALSGGAILFQRMFPAR